MAVCVKWDRQTNCLTHTLKGGLYNDVMRFCNIIQDYKSIILQNFPKPQRQGQMPILQPDSQTGGEATDTQTHHHL